mgnify:CR=1 FL=1
MCEPQNVRPLPLITDVHAPPTVRRGHAQPVRGAGAAIGLRRERRGHPSGGPSLRHKLLRIRSTAGHVRAALGAGFLRYEKIEEWCRPPSSRAAILVAAARRRVDRRAASDAAAATTSYTEAERGVPGGTRDMPLVAVARQDAQSDAALLRASAAIKCFVVLLG